MTKDTKKISHKEMLKAYLLEGNMVNWCIAEAEISPEKPFIIRSLPQRILEIDMELQEAGLGFIKATKEYAPRRAEYRFYKYTDKDKTSKDT